jgi:hypothetical protein
MPYRIEELIRQTAKWSVFSAEDLTGMAPSPVSPVNMTDFLLEHDPEKWIPVFRKDHAPPKI